MGMFLGGSQLVICASISHLGPSAWVLEIQRDIARRLRYTMDEAQIYKTMRSLTTQGLVQRVPARLGGQGTRVVVYELTGDGRAALARTAAIAMAAIGPKYGENP